MSVIDWTPEQDDEHRQLSALPFRMVILDVFRIKYRGVAVMGRVQAGVVNKGEGIVIEGHGRRIETRVAGLILLPKLPRDLANLFLRDVATTDIEAGMIITKQGET